MKVIKNMLLEIVTLILLVINLYMFFIQSGIARIQQIETIRKLISSR